MLGGIILRNEVLAKLPHLEPEDFFSPKHQAVFGAMRNLESRGRPIDPITLELELDRKHDDDGRSKFEAIGGHVYLAELALRVPTPDNVVDYARQVVEAKLVRNIRVLCDEIAIEAIDRKTSGGELLRLLRSGLSVFEARAAHGDLAPIRWRAPDLAGLITENATLPWVSLRLGVDLVELARARAKSVVMITAASGAGKSSFALELLWRHAIEVGPAIFFSLELDADEAGGRIIGQRCAASWEDSLRCRVPLHEMQRALDLPRLVILAGDDAVPDKLVTAVETLRAENPGQPILVCVDYLQILELETYARDERSKVKDAVEWLRRLAQRLKVVILAISQTSRAAAQKLKDGQLVGADTASTGAESSQIERAGTLTISLGGKRDLEDGTSTIDVSIGKGRMGQGDRVVPANYDGRIGTWRITGEARSATEVRAERATEHRSAAVSAAMDAIAGYLARAKEPRSRNDVRKNLHLKPAIALAAFKQLLAEPDPKRVVRVKGKKPGGFYQLWSPTRATEAGRDLVPDEVED